MDTLFQFVLTLFTGLLTILVLGCLLQKYYPSNSATTGHHEPPQAGGAWPIIGHMHLFGSNQLTHKTLGAMADKFGPIFTIKLGMHKALVLNSWEVAKECFTTQDRACSNRPSITASKLLTYDFAMVGFAPYGSYWRDIRKTIIVELLSNQRLDMLKHIRANGIKIWIRELHDLWGESDRKGQGVLVDLKPCFGDLTYNVTIQMVGGKRYFGRKVDTDEEEVQRVREVMREFSHLFGVFVLSDAIPYLGWLDFNGYEKKMRRVAKELDTVIEGWLEEHKERRTRAGEANFEQDLMDALLNILQDSNISDFDADTINKATCLNIIIAATDTTMVSLTWALSLLLNHPQVLERVRDELETHVGRDRHVDESDIKNLIYLQAVVKEMFRLYPPAPVNGLRSTIENCTLSGYNISANTRLMINIWKIHRDERMWQDALEFRPERFLTSHLETDVRGQHFEYIPFGSGRRVCPGITFALQMIHLTLASLLHCFEIKTPNGEPVDMTESQGLTNSKATPLHVLLTPRLSFKLYV